MNTRILASRCSSCWPRRGIHVIVAAIILASARDIRAQGTVSFSGQVGLYGTNYVEGGMLFHVAVPTHGTGSPGYDSMGIGGAITTPANVPYNDTPYMIFNRFYSPDDYVTFGLTTGLAFGLTSAQLADPNSPSSSTLPITFLGSKADGSTVTNTFTTPGNGADHLLSYQFTSDFASGLSSVNILAPRWAMDNLVFTVPEPGSAALVALGLLGLVLLRRGREWHAR